MNIAIILATGNNTKFLGENKDLPKQVIDIYRKEVIAYSLESYSNHPLIDEIVVVCNLEYQKKCEDIIKKYDIKKVKGVVSGGVTRQSSVLSALEYLSSFYKLDNENVIIHEADRIIISEELISNHIEALDTHDAVSTITSLNDQIILSEDGVSLDKTLDMNKVYMMQTPQSFKYDLLYSAHKFALNLELKDSIDDASLMKLFNKDVYLLKESKHNLKIVSIDDLEILKGLLENK